MDEQIIIPTEPEFNINGLNAGNITFTDCVIKNIKFYGVDSVEIIISPLHTRLLKRIKAWFFGSSRIFKAEGNF